MTRPRTARRRSLRGRVLVAAAVATFLLVSGFAGFVRFSVGMRNELAEATDSFGEEQAIADEMLRAVTRQLVAGSYFARSHNESSMPRWLGQRAKSSLGWIWWFALLAGVVPFVLSSGLSVKSGDIDSYRVRAYYVVRLMAFACWATSCVVGVFYVRHVTRAANRSARGRGPEESRVVVR